jgi:O-antigen/teichoic acid export membrane protein
LGIIRRQSIQSSILFYIGAAIGFANKVLIFTNFLSLEQVGLANILVTNAMLYAQFSALGFTTMTLRFFPYFQDKLRGHHSFLFWLLAIPLLGFLLVTLAVLIFQRQILGYFQQESPLMVEYFWYLIPLAFATLYFDLFDAYLRSLLKTVVPILFKEIIQRLFITVSVLIYAVGWISFPQFVLVYVALLCSNTLLIIIYTSWLGHLHLLPKRSWRFRMLFPKVMIFGGFTLLGNMSAIVLNNIDSLMLASYIGMDAVGIYTTFFYVSALILIPWRAIQKIASPQVAEYWKTNDLEKMNALYKRTSLINLGIGCYLFMMMFLGIPALFELMPDAFEEGWVVLVIIGITRVLDMVTGLNTYILIMSKYFKVELVLSLFVLVVGIALNVIFIPKYGIAGATICTGTVINLANFLRSIYLWSKFRLNPFSPQMLTVLVITVVASGVYFIPSFGNPIVFYALQGLLFTVIFGGLVLKFQAIPDSNKLVELVANKIKRVKQ